MPHIPGTNVPGIFLCHNLVGRHPSLVILSDRRESKDLRTNFSANVPKVRRSFDFGLRPSLRMTGGVVVGGWTQRFVLGGGRYLVGGVSDPALRIFRLAAVGDRKGRPWDLFISRKSTGNFIPEAVALGRKKSYNEENDPRKKFQRRE